MTCALYARTSTTDQDCSLQLNALREHAQRFGWTTVEYVEQESTRKTRPVLERLMRDAAARKVQVICVWKLDRFGRSVRELVNNIEALDCAGVRFIAITQGIDTDQRNPTSKLLLQMLAAIAEFERDLIRERVKAGMKVAKANGAAIGRPALVVDRLKLREMVATMGTRKAAAELGISKSTAAKLAAKGKE